MQNQKDTWKWAPEDATHFHKYTGMFYKLLNGKMFVFGSNNKWNPSKVREESASLVPRPITKTKEKTNMKTAKLEVISVDFSNPVELKAKLLEAGLPMDMVQEVLDEVAEEDTSEEHVAEKVKIIGNELEKVLKYVKEELELDFDVLHVMRQMGFVKPSKKDLVAEMSEAFCKDKGLKRCAKIDKMVEQVLTAMGKL